MAPFYTSLCDEFKWDIDHQLLIEMNQENEKKLIELQDKLEDAETNFGDNEVREALLARAKFFCQIGSKVNKIFQDFQLLQQLILITKNISNKH